MDELNVYLIDADQLNSVLDWLFKTRIPCKLRWVGNIKKYELRF